MTLDCVLRALNVWDSSSISEVMQEVLESEIDAYRNVLIEGLMLFKKFALLC